MPLYEFVCDRCATKFEVLRPVSRMDEPAPCPKGHGTSQRVISRFAALTRDEFGESESVTGGGCGGCAGGCTCGAN